MIYTVTFNPSIDYIMYVHKLQKGEIGRSHSEKYYWGGKGINVSRILGELGVESTCMGFIAGFTGAEIENGIINCGIKADFVKLQSGNSRINVKIRSEEETDINGNGPDIQDADIQVLFNKLDRLEQGDILVLAGSVPNTLPSDIYEKIMERLSTKEIGFIVDAEKDLLINSIKYRPFLIKPNNDELSEIFNEKINSPEKALKYAAKLQEMGALNVLVSMGDKGAVLLDEYGNNHYRTAHTGTVANTVGAGDSMVAGFIAGYLEKSDYEYALQLGTAAGCATAFSEGLAVKTEILSFM